jgi:hypothetical protein
LRRFALRQLWHLQRNLRGQPLPVRDHAQLSPHDQSAAWFGLELYCSGDDIDGNPLVSTTCSYPSFTLRYYNNAGVLTDELFDQGAATLTLYVVDGG